RQRLDPLGRAEAGRARQGGGNAGGQGAAVGAEPVRPVVSVRAAGKFRSSWRKVRNVPGRGDVWTAAARPTFPHDATAERPRVRGRTGRRAAGSPTEARTTGAVRRAAAAGRSAAPRRAALRSAAPRAATALWPGTVRAGPLRAAPRPTAALRAATVRAATVRPGALRAAAVRAGARAGWAAEVPRRAGVRRRGRLFRPGPGAGEPLGAAGRRHRRHRPRRHRHPPDL